MQLKSILLSALAAGAAFAQDSVCDKYTKALLKENSAANQYTLVTLLVKTAFIGNFTGKGTMNPMLPGSMVNVPGIVAQGQSYKGMPVNLLPYFNGDLMSTNSFKTGMPASVNFLDGGGAQALISNATSAGMMGSNQYTLLTHLVQYFGALLKCSQYGQMGFPAYKARSSQYEVHKYMDLGESEFGYFVQQVGLAAQSFGATMDDINAVAMSLNTTFGQRCSPPAAVIPSQGKQLQAMCIADSCPKASDATCGAYAPAKTPMKAVKSPGMGMMGGAMPTPMMGGSNGMGGGMGGAGASNTMGGGMMGTATGGSGASATSAGAANMVPNALAAGVAGLAAFAL